jgi:hypothetical protein
MGIGYKRHFPQDWSEEKILRCVTSIANDPILPRKQITAKSGMWLPRPPKFIIEGTREGIPIRVVVEPDDRGILTAYPINE